MKTAKAPEAPKDFIIIYEGERIPVSKIKLAMYASNFKEIINQATMNTIKISDTAPLTTMVQFIKAIQGEQFALTPDNVNDIQRLAQKWGANTVLEATANYLDSCSELGSIVNSVQKDPNTELSQQLLENFAAQIDAAISIPSFAEFTLDNLIKIFSNSKLRVKDHHNLQRFLLKILGIHGRKASQLFTCLDLSRLTPREALEILENNNLDKSYIGESAANVCIHLIKESNDLKKQMNILSSRLEDIEQYNFADEFSRINQAFQVIETRIEKNIPRASTKSAKVNANLDKRVDQKLQILAEGVAKKITEVESRIKKQDRAQTTHFKEALDKLKQVEAGIDPLKSESREMRRSIRSVLQKQIEIEEALKGDAFLPADSIQLPFAGHSFDGILAYLTDVCQGNVHDKRVVIISASSCEHGSPSVVASRDPSDFFLSENKSGQWIRFDFNENVVALQHYSLKSHRYSGNSTHLKNWAIEGSNDNEEWMRLDRRTTSVLNGANKFQTFPITNPSGTFRYIRLKMTDVNYRGDNVLGLQSIEFFGALMKAMPQSVE